MNLTSNKDYNISLAIQSIDPTARCKVIYNQKELPVIVCEDGEISFTESELDVKGAELNRLYGHVECRVKNYPPIHEQLDMIYWDKVNQTTVWEDTISNIKNNICPKGQ